MNTIRLAWTWVNKTWCSVAHPSPLWPIHGQYQCPKCFRVYQVEWEPKIARPVRAQ